MTISKKMTLLLTVLAIVGIYHFTPLKELTPNAIRVFLLQFGAWAPIIYIILFTIVPLTLFPDAVLAITSGLIFGVTFGFVYTIIGALCGGSLAFFIARFLGHDFIATKVKEHANLNSLISQREFPMILILRLIPLIPFDVISYASGISGIRYKDFILGTVLGIIPGVFLLTNIGAGMSELNSPRLYLSTAAFVLLIVFAKTFADRLSLFNAPTRNS